MINYEITLGKKNLANDSRIQKMEIHLDHNFLAVLILCGKGFQELKLIFDPFAIS